MIINGLNILSEYNLILTERNIQNCNVVNFVDWLSESISPIKLKKEKYKFSSINIKLLVEGDTEESILNKISSIVAKCKSGILKFSDLRYSYNVTLDSSENKIIYENAYELSLQFKSDFKIEDEVTENINRVTIKTINVKGNQDTPAIVEITPINDIIYLTLEGLDDDPIIIKNLKANKTVIIDGEMQKVTIDGVNKYGDTDMWGFPRLIPGENNIKVSRSNCDIKIKYKSRLI